MVHRHFASLSLAHLSGITSYSKVSGEFLGLWTAGIDHFVADL
jgi:hypothetical protein